MPLWESRDLFARVVGLQGALPRDAKLPEILNGNKPGKGQFLHDPANDTAHGRGEAY